MTAAAPQQLPVGAPLVDLETLHAIMTRLSTANGRRYIEPLNRAMREFQINTVLRKAAFLAQIAHESAELLYFEELASGRAYDITVNPRKARDLGNTRPGDGMRYKGRGPIQLTGRANYRAAGAALGVNLEASPERAATPDLGFRVAGWFWHTKGLNPLADAQKFREITRRINGGYRGYAHRRTFYERALRVLR